VKRRYLLWLPPLLAAACLLFLFFQRQAGESVGAFFPSRRAGETLVIDAGHGGEDGGAVSPNGTVESQINLSIALKLDQMAGLFGVQTLMIRTEDRSIHDADAQTLREMKRSDLENRVAIVEQAAPATLISVHQNIYSDGRYHGAQVFYSDEAAGKPLAEYTQQLLAQQLDPENKRQAARISSDVYLMKHITCRAILVECGFLSNAEEERLLQEDGYQSKLAAILLAAYLSFEGAGQG